MYAEKVLSNSGGSTNDNIYTYIETSTATTTADGVTINWWGGWTARYTQSYSNIYHSVGYRIDDAETSVENNSNNSVQNSGSDWTFHRFNETGNYTFERKSYSYTVYLYSYSSVSSYQYGMLSSQAEVSLEIPAKTSDKYTVTFNANGGSGTMASITKTAETIITLPANTFTRTGYTFDYWRSVTATTQGTLADKARFIFTEDTTLSAIWKGKTYKVTFNANGGSSSTATKTVTYASTYGTLPTPTRTNYNFLGWFTTQTGGTQITSSSNVTTASNHTLWAHWERGTATRVYNANYGTSPTTKSAEIKAGTPVTALPSASYFSRSGYFLYRWCATSDDTGSRYMPESTDSSLAQNKGTTKTYYAIWERNYTSPSFTSAPSVVRCGANGATDDSGTYFKITVPYSIYTGLLTNTTVGTNQISVSVSYISSGSSVTATMSSTYINSKTGTFTAYCTVNPNLNVDSSYPVTITITDNRTFDSRYGVTTANRSASFTSHVSSAYFLFDVSPQNGIGIGRSAPASKRIYVGTSMLLPKGGDGTGGLFMEDSDGTTRGVLQRNSSVGDEGLLIGYGQRAAGLNAYTAIYGEPIYLYGPVTVRDAASFNNAVSTGALTCDSLTIGGNSMSDWISSYNYTTVTLASGASMTWYWWKYKSGRCILYARLTLSSVTVNTAWGSLYEGTNTNLQAGLPYPFPLTAVRSFQATATANGAAPCGIEIAQNPNSSANLTKTPPLYILRPNSTTSNGYVVELLVVGAY